MFTFWKVNIKSHENYPLKYTPENFPRKITSQIIDPVKLPQEDYSPLQIILPSISLLPRKKMQFLYRQNRKCYILSLLFQSFFPVGNYLFTVNNINTRTRCGICSKLIINTPELRQCLYC